jgi:MFS family permease
MPPEPTPAKLRGNLNWQRLWFSQAVSVLGDFVFNTTIVLWVGTVIAEGQPWAPAAVGGVLIAAAVPVVLVGPIAGVYVDRWDRRRIMMATDLIRAGLVAVLLVIPVLGTHWPVGLQLTIVYALVAMASAASQFFNPARFAIIGAVVESEAQPRAFGMLTATASTAAVIGPPLAAPLLFVTGVHWALIINAVSFLISFVAIRLIHIPRAAPADGVGRTGFWPEFKQGLAYFVRHRTLIVIVMAVCLYTIGVGAINVLDVFFVNENLHAEPKWLGTLNAAFGVGSIVGSLLAATVTKWLGQARAFGVGIIATGLMVLVYSRTSMIATAIVFLALASVPLAIVNVVLGPLVLQETPKELIGRVNAVLSPVVYLASMLSMALAGFLASTVMHDMQVTFAGVHFGRIDTIFGVSALLMTAAGAVAIRLLTKTPSKQPVEQLQPPAEVRR